MSETSRNIGIPVQMPGKQCSDSHCPFHGSLHVRGRILNGKVLKEPFHKTITVEFPRLHYIYKYERYEKRRSRIKAHVPGCLAVKNGQKVKIMECRPISKTKSFVVVGVETAS